MESHLPFWHCLHLLSGGCCLWLQMTAGVWKRKWHHFHLPEIIGVTFLGKWSFVSHRIPLDVVLLKVGREMWNSADSRKTADFGKIRRFPWNPPIFKIKIDVSPWILTMEWKLIVSFTSFKPKSVKSTKSAVCGFSQNPWISRILQLWRLGLWLSKVFQTKDQKPTTKKSPKF